MMYNYIDGTLPASIGNLTELYYLCAPFRSSLSIVTDSIPLTMLRPLRRPQGVLLQPLPQRNHTARTRKFEENARHVRQQSARRGRGHSSMPNALPSRAAGFTARGPRRP